MLKELTDQFDNFADDFIRESVPRSIIIVGSSRIDDLLCQILCEYMLPKTSATKEQDELLEGDKPLATFSSRIKIVYRLGLIDKSLYETLEIIRNIRNKSAHKISFDVNKSPLREYILSLNSKTVKRISFKLTKERYFTDDFQNPYDEIKCIYLTVCILLESVYAKIERIKANTVFQKITSK